MMLFVFHLILLKNIPECRAEYMTSQGFLYINRFDCLILMLIYCGVLYAVIYILTQQPAYQGLGKNEFGFCPHIIMIIIIKIWL